MRHTFVPFPIRKYAEYCEENEIRLSTIALERLSITVQDLQIFFPLLRRDNVSELIYSDQDNLTGTYTEMSSLVMHAARSSRVDVKQNNIRSREMRAVG